MATVNVNKAGKEASSTEATSEKRSKYLWKNILIDRNDRRPKEEGTHGCDFLSDLIQGIIIIHSTNILEDLLCARLGVEELAGRLDLEDKEKNKKYNS